MRGRRTGDWQQALNAVNVPHAPVWDYAQLFSDPQAAARGLRVTVRDPQGQPLDLVGSPFHIAGTTLRVPSAPPRLGEHTRDVLSSLLGLKPKDLEKLSKDGVIND